MPHYNSIFHQLLKVIPRHRFERLVDVHKGDYRARHLRCWDQFVSLLYAQLTGCDSLRELEAGFNSHVERHYHLGCQPVARSTLAKANEKRPSSLYEDVLSFLLGKLLQNESRVREALLLLDSTTIPLNQTLFDWAEFRSHKHGVKLHLAYNPRADMPCFFAITPAKKNDMKAAAEMPIQSGATYVFDRAYNDYRWWQELHDEGCTFVTRLKKNVTYVTETWNLAKGDGVLTDDIITMKQRCTAPLRRITYHCPVKDKRLVFVTNNLDISALEVASLYRERWQVELFFKWVKQNLKIKKFIGTSMNAVKTQIIIALIAYVILRLVQQTKMPDQTLRHITNLTKANIFQKKTWIDLIIPPDKTKVQRKSNQLEFALC